MSNTKTHMSQSMPLFLSSCNPDADGTRDLKLSVGCFGTVDRREVSEHWFSTQFDLKVCGNL